jgi:hypothetical protein
MPLKESEVYLDDEDYRGRYILFGLLGLILVIGTAGFLIYGKYASSESNVSLSSQKNTSNLTAPLVNASTTGTNATNGSVSTKYAYSIKALKDLDKRACGAGPEDLFRWFGKPMYPLAWERALNGSRGEPNSFQFFVWNQTILYTSGKMNATSGNIETFRYLARKDDDNRTAQKLIEC